jgi:hypothetical protein
VFILISALSLSACFKKPAGEDNPVMNTAPQGIPVYKAATDSYIRLSGPCQGNASVRISYSSDKTTTNVIKVNCINDTLAVNAPVQQGLSSQLVRFEFRGYKKEKYTSPLYANVYYDPQPSAMPGFAVTSGGGTPANDGGTISMVNSTIGEIVDPIALTGGATMSAKTGLQGLLNP